MNQSEMTEQETIDVTEHQDYVFEENAGHAEGQDAEREFTLLAEVPAALKSPEGGFVPDTPEKVDWVLGRIADHRSRAARIRENAEKMALAAERDAMDMEWLFGPSLQAYVRAVIDGTKRKSVRFYNGVMGYRMKPASVMVGNEAAAIDWAKTHLPAAVVERLDKRALAQTLLETGEMTDFAELVPASEIFYIK